MSHPDYKDRKALQIGGNEACAEVAAEVAAKGPKSIWKIKD